MQTIEKKKLYEQLCWDYNLSAKDIEAVLKGEKTNAGHYNRQSLFRKLIETYSWFTVLQLLTPDEIRELLSDKVIQSLKVPSLRNQYEFIQKRLHEIKSASG